MSSSRPEDVDSLRAPYKGSAAAIDIVTIDVGSYAYATECDLPIGFIGARDLSRVFH